MHDALIAWCGTGSGRAFAMLLAGLAASPLHCGPMCGGFVLGQVSDRMARLPLSRLTECQRLRAAALPRYHLGRLGTYMLLGALAGAGGFAVSLLGAGGGVFLIAAAALLALQAAGRLHAPFALPFTRGLRGYALGAALGFLPCGVLYAALAAAASSGSAAEGALSMLCFGIGTVPALAAAALFGAAGGHRVRRALTLATPVILAINAGVLGALGVSLLTAR